MAWSETLFTFHLPRWEELPALDLYMDQDVYKRQVLSKLMCELIVDGVHVHPDIVQATYKMIGAERIVLISDANPCKQLPKGEYLFSGKHVLVDKDKALSLIHI